MIYKGDKEPQTTFTPSQLAQIKHMEHMIQNLQRANRKWKDDYHRVLVEVLSLRLREDERRKAEIMDGSFNDLRVKAWQEGKLAVLHAFRASMSGWMLRHMESVPNPECPYLLHPKNL